MNLNLERPQKTIFFLALFILIPLWNISHTIAGRYACEALLLITVISYRPDWKLFFEKNKLLLIFFVYLLIQLFFFSENFNIALNNFRSEWMHFILFSVIGAGVGLVLGKKASPKILLYLGIAFSFPLHLHLILSLIKGISIGGIPWGYWGISEIHGDFGYPALEAAILLFTFYLYKAKDKFECYLAIGLIIICIASPFLAMSRAGAGFTILAVITILVFHFFVGAGNKIGFLRKLLLLLVITVSVLTMYTVGLASDPNRWGGISTRLSVGLEGSPLNIYCNGITSLEKALNQKGIEITPAIQQGLDSVVNGDGARIMAARSGAILALKHPMGIDQSKQAYQIAIRQYCNDNPQIFISHTHNAWIDTALAIGIPGTILLLLIMMQYAKLGYRAYIENTANSPYGLALLASATLWTIRGITDSTMRDQMLEMQAFVLALLLGILLARKDTAKE